MNNRHRTHDIRAFAVVVFAAGAFATTSYAETFDFKVAYAQGPATDAILSGNMHEAIEILEGRRQDPDSRYVTDELSTLCALYVVTNELESARPTCDAAVDNDRSFAAFNNRGVLRAHLRDTEGALEDFARARVRPGEEQEFIESLIRGNARLIAGSNYKIMNRFIAKLADSEDPVRMQTFRTADVEELDPR